MALITLPSSPSARQVNWLPPAKSQINTSGWSGTSQAVVITGALWRATVSYPPIIAASDERAWRAFVMKLQGQVNTFQLPAVPGGQGLTANVIRVNGASQTGATLVTDGWPASYSDMKAGHYFTLDGRLYMLTADVSADGLGNDTISFLPALVSSPADNAILEINAPYATVRLASDDTGWSEQISFTEFEFSVVEAR